MSGIDSNWRGRMLIESRLQKIEVAEGQGFEPWDGLPSPVFKTGAFGHSATPPFEAGLYRLKNSKQGKLYSFSCLLASVSLVSVFL